MSFGFLGIQYGFGLQQANMSPIYRYLGADEASIPGLWLAGPLTGLLLQPIIGALSDKSWSPRWGRRKPYVFVGAIVGSIAMLMMPNSSSVLMAASLMWLLDAGLNSSMEPFRAFVGDIVTGSLKRRLTIHQRALAGIQHRVDFGHASLGPPALFASGEPPAPRSITLLC